MDGLYIGGRILYFSMCLFLTVRLTIMHCPRLFWASLGLKMLTISAHRSFLFINGKNALHYATSVRFIGNQPVMCSLLS